MHRLNDRDATANLTRAGFFKGAAGVGLAAGGATLLADRAQASELAAGAKRGGTLTVGVGQVIEDINPTTAGLYRWLQLIAISMYEPLVKYGNDGSVIPVLAEKIESSKDFKTWTLTIRQGVKFHNGKPLTVGDVVNAIATYNSPKKSNSGLGTDVFKSVRALDDHRVRITTKKPYRVDQYMRWWFIFPNDPSINKSKTIVGTGPFMLKSYVKGSGISVVRNPNYWRKGQPYLDGINFRFLKDASAQLANLFAGDVNYLHDVPVNLVDQVTQRSSKSQLVSSGLFFHWWAPQLLTGPLTDLKVRQALLYAFDRKKMNEVAWAGKGIDTRDPFTQTPYGIKSGIAPIPYDPEKAKALLAAAGASNIKVPINVLQGSVQGPLEAQVMQQGFQAAGIDSAVNILDTATWSKQAYTDRTHEGLIEDYGTVPFPFPLIGTYLLQPFVFPNPKDNSPSAAPKSYAALTKAKEAVADAVLEDGPDRAAARHPRRGVHVPHVHVPRTTR